MTDKPLAGLKSALEAKLERAKYVRYVCPLCDEEHDTMQDAAACEASCATGPVHPKVCPVCHVRHESIAAAVDCCQWKTMDYGARYRLAKELELTVY